MGRNEENQTESIDSSQVANPGGASQGTVGGPKLIQSDAGEKFPGDERQLGSGRSPGGS